MAYEHPFSLRQQPRHTGWLKINNNLQLVVSIAALLLAVIIISVADHADGASSPNNFTFSPRGGKRIASEATPIEGGFFGWSVAVSGDGSKVFVGQPGFNGNAGRVAVYDREGTYLSQLYLDSPNTWFGWGVDSCANGTKVVASSLFEQGGWRRRRLADDEPFDPTDVPVGEGALYIFDMANPTFPDVVVRSSDLSITMYGYVVAVTSDCSRVCVTSDVYDSDSGNFHCYSIDGTEILNSPYMPDQTSTNARFGKSMAMSKDDGTVVVVGIPARESQGGFYVYRYSALDQRYMIIGTVRTSPDPTWLDFGAAVAVDSAGSLIAVGGGGLVALYTWTGSDYNLLQTILSTSYGTASLTFGNALVLSPRGTKLVIGDSGRDSGVGGFFSLSRNDGSPGDLFVSDHSSAFQPSNPTSSGTFARSMAANDAMNQLIVGDWAADARAGAFFAFEPATSTPATTTKSPSSAPTTSRPSVSPSKAPSTGAPTKSPSSAPTNTHPSVSPSKAADTGAPSQPSSRPPSGSNSGAATAISNWVLVVSAAALLSASTHFY